MAAQSDADRDIASDIYQGNILDRATPVQNMIGELAMQGQLDFQQVYGAYQRLNEDTRRNFTFANFMSLKKMEREVIQQGQRRVPELLDVNSAIDRQLNAQKAAQSRNRVIGVLTAIVGSAVLLAANVITQRSPRRDAEPSQPHG